MRIQFGNRCFGCKRPRGLGLELVERKATVIVERGERKDGKRVLVTEAKTPCPHCGETRVVTGMAVQKHKRG